MPDDVEKFLSDKQQLESRRQELIKETLRQKGSRDQGLRREACPAGIRWGSRAEAQPSQAQPRSEKAEV